jgi:undecaprenyl-diphosphatase
VPFFEIVLLAVVQALTEFLPISSSGHLYLASLWFGYEYQGLTFDLGLHLGTLIAVLGYFRADLLEMASAARRWRPGLSPMAEPGTRLLLFLLIATVPSAIAGLILSQMHWAELLRHPVLIGCNLLLFGILLAVAVKLARKRALDTLTVKDAVIVGLMQMLALIPGVSRSGITMSAGMLRGLSVEQAARFSFLLAIPVTALAALKGVFDVLKGNELIRISDFLWGVALAAVFGLIVVHAFFAIIKRIGLMPFVWYRLILGLGLIAYYGFWLR